MSLTATTWRPSARRRWTAAAVAASFVAAGLVAGTGVSVASAAPSYVILSQGRTATASSTAGVTSYLASEAVDGNVGSRWQSGDGDPQWLQVDLGSAQQVSRVVLDWETARAKAYTVDVSTDGSTWTSVYTATSADADSGGGHYRRIVDLADAVTARYVRMDATARETPWNYSLYELQVYGRGADVPDAEPVAVVRTGDDTWQLQVGGKPWLVKGLTWGPSSSITDAQLDAYLDQLVAAGVNTIRTWGTDASSERLLTHAAVKGIKVIAGFWVQPGGGPGSGGCPDFVIPSASDTTYLNAVISDVKKYVAMYKDNPGVLMWDIGNESINGLNSCYGPGVAGGSAQKLEDERNAYAAFIETAVQAAKSVDTTHPVTSTDAYVGAWKYYKAHTPSLDLLAVNSYGAIDGVHDAWVAGDYGKPYVVTEAGPDGEWEVPDDANGVPTEPSDVAKAAGYTRAWQQVTDHPGQALGATMFHFGVEKDLGGVWLNVLTGGEKRLGYYALAQAYGGTAAHDDQPPVISSMTVPSGKVAPGSTFTVSAAATDPDGDDISYEVDLSGAYANGNSQLVAANAVDKGNGTFQVTAPQAPGVWKVYVLARDGHGNVGIETRSVNVADTATNLALHRPATSSPDAQFPAANAVDGYAGTKYGSYVDGDNGWKGRDDEWFQVDLGQTTSIDRVKIAWEGAYGKSYDIQTSTDGTHWTTAGQVRAQTLTSFPAWVEHTFTPVDARYVRLQGIARGTAYGYSFYEFQVFGTGDGDQPPTGTDGCSTDVTAGATATASSEQDTVNHDRQALFAVDGVYQQDDSTPRWGSALDPTRNYAGTDDEWLQVTLAQPQTVCAVKLQWEAAYGRSYDIEVSSDGQSWTTAAAVRDQLLTQFPATVTHPFAPVTAQYVRMKGITRGTAYGWSIFEMRVLAGTSTTDPGTDPGAGPVVYHPTVSAAASAVIGSSLKVTGSGFAKGERVSVSLGSSTATVTASSTGAVSASVKAADAGLQSLSVRGAVSKVTVKRSVTVSKAAARATVKVSPAKVQYGKKLTVKVTVAGPAGVPSGSVQFFDGARKLGKPVKLAGGVARVSSSTLKVGTHRLKATYAGSGTYAKVTSAAVTVKVAKAKVTSVKVSAKKYVKGAHPVVTVTVGRLDNGKRASGTVKVYVNGKKVASVRLSSTRSSVKVTLPRTSLSSVEVRATFVPKKSTVVSSKSSKTTKVRSR